MTLNGEDVKVLQPSKEFELRVKLEVARVDIGSEESCISLQETQVGLSDTLS